MNEKSKTEKTAFGLNEEKFCRMMEEQGRLSKESFEDEALEQFVKGPENQTYMIKLYRQQILSYYFFFFVLFVQFQS